MVDFSKIEIREINEDSYFVFDKEANQMLLEVRRWHAKGTFVGRHDGRVEIYDVRGTSGEKRLLRSMSGSNFNKTHLAQVVLNVLDELMCQICLKEWGPVCDRCYQDTADSLFILNRQIERLELDRGKN